MYRNISSFFVSLKPQYKIPKLESVHPYLLTLNNARGEQLFSEDGCMRLGYLLGGLHKEELVESHHNLSRKCQQNHKNH